MRGHEVKGDLKKKLRSECATRRERKQTEGESGERGKQVDRYVRARVRSKRGRGRSHSMKGRQGKSLGEVQREKDWE